MDSVEQSFQTPISREKKAGRKEKEEIEKYYAENCWAKPVDLTVKFLAR